MDPRACPACLKPPNPLLALDRAPPSPRSAFVRARKVENNYARRLRKVANHIGDILRGFDILSFFGISRLQTALKRYSDALEPWAEAVGERMVREVAARDERSWFRVSQEISEGLKKEIAEAPTGRIMQELMREQVRLITSLPAQAAERIQRLAIQAYTEGRRTETLVEEIMRTGDVTRSRAELIARTEVNRVATALTQARAEFVGSEGYIWRTCQDDRVRASHNGMEGRFVRWSDPPTLDNLTGHAGALPNCRCWPEPVLPTLQ